MKALLSIFTLAGLLASTSVAAPVD